MGKFSEIENDLIQIKSKMIQNTRDLDFIIKKVDKVREDFKHTPKERVDYLQEELNKLKDRLKE